MTPLRTPRRDAPAALAALAAAALVLVAPALAAQQPAADTTRLEPVVVTATRTPVARSAVPVSVTVITGEQLRAQGIVRLTDALRQVPGAAVAQSGAFGATTTLFLRGGERDYVKVLVDGVPVNDAGGDFDFASVTTDNVDRIEVLRGPGSVVYGSDAVSGVIQIFTRRGAGRARATIDARAGSYGTREASADVAAARGAVSYSAGAASRRTDGILAFNNDYRNDALGGQLRFALGAADVQLSTRYNASEYHFPTDFAGAVTDSNQFTRERRLSSGVDAGYRFGRALSTRLLLTDNRSSRLSDNAPDSPGDSAGFYSRDDADRYRRGADARLDARLRPGALVTVGAAYEAEGEASRGTSAFGAAPLPATSFHERRVNRAAYAQTVLEAHDRATLALGGRYDDNGSFGIFRTGRAALSIALTGRLRVRAAAGNAFKEPAFAEVFSTAFATGNPALRPERSRSVEAGLEATVAGAVTLGATWFSQRFDDLVQFVPSDPASSALLPNYFNLASAKAAGVDVELRTRPLAGVSAAAQFGYVATRVLDAGTGASGTFVAGDALLRRPTRTASATLTYARAHGSSLATTVSHVGSRSDRDFSAFPARAVTLSAYTTLDLAAALALPLPRSGPSLALTVRAENALGRRYQSVYGYDAPRAVVLLGARLTVPE